MTKQEIWKQPDDLPNVGESLIIRRGGKCIYGQYLNLYEKNIFNITRNLTIETTCRPIFVTLDSFVDGNSSHTEVTNIEAYCTLTDFVNYCMGER